MFSIMSGAMADIWNNEQRGIAIAIFRFVIDTLWDQRDD